MKAKLAVVFSAAAIAALGAGASEASAAHCVAPASEPTSPGFSYFGTDHVKESAHSGGPEGGNPGPHAGTSGASNCRATTGSPSERAPGQNR